MDPHYCVRPADHTLRIPLKSGSFACLRSQPQYSPVARCRPHTGPTAAPTMGPRSALLTDSRRHSDHGALGQRSLLRGSQADTDGVPGRAPAPPQSAAAAAAAGL